MKRFHALTKRLFLPVLVVAMLGGCVGDRYTESLPAEEKDTYLLVELKVPGASAPASRSFDDSKEKNINRLDVLAFSIDGGGNETFAYHEQGNKQLNSTFQVRVKKSVPASQQFRFVFLANLTNNEVAAAVKHATNPFVVSTTTKADALAAITFVESGAWDTTTPRYLPMWGESDAMPILSDLETIVNTPVQMLRAVARIDITKATTVTNFTIKEAYLYNYSTRGLAAPLAASYTPGAKNEETTPHASITALSLPAAADGGRGAVQYQGIGSDIYLKWETASGEFASDIYVLEAPKTAAFGSTTATALVIGGLYEGSMNYYRVDLKSDISGYLHILRNYCYQLKIISVDNPGKETPDEAFEVPIDIKTEINKWPIGVSEDVICD